MINWDKELEKIFADPLLADVTAPPKKVTSSDRLIAGFQRIVEFVEANGRHPQSDADREERSLYNQLKGILSDPVKKERCRPARWFPNLHPPMACLCRRLNSSWRLSLPTRFWMT